MLVVKCKPLFVKPIAHELVFKDSYERTIQNAFRFVFMSILPNIIFGFISFILFLISPNLTILGTLGVMAIFMGV